MPQAADAVFNNFQVFLTGRIGRAIHKTEAIMIFLSVAEVNQEKLKQLLEQHTERRRGKVIFSFSAQESDL